MVRIVLSAFAGFVAWLILWVGSETFLSAIGPEWYGVHQRAFEAAIIEGGPFTANTTLLLIQIVLASIVSVTSGFLASTIAGENKRAPSYLSVLLLIFGLLKVTMSWQYVPIWHHIIFLSLLVPMTVMGGKLKTFPTVKAREQSSENSGL